MRKVSEAFDRQSLFLESILNCRELGGYVLPDGCSVRRGLLLRGGDLAKVSDADLQTLSERYHVVLDFDFRTESEVRKAPDRVPEGARLIWLPAIDEKLEKSAANCLPEEAYADLPAYLVGHSSDPMIQDAARRLYSEMVLNEYTQLQYAAFFQSILASPAGAVFWHCSQGKDRTGLGAAFMLGALGADRQLIMHDYLLSMDFYRPLVNRFLPLVATKGEKDTVLTFIGVNAEYFLDALKLIDSNFGSFDEYLKGPLCLSEGDFTALRDRFLE